jgi:hypothetical protein
LAGDVAPAKLALELELGLELVPELEPEPQPAASGAVASAIRASRLARLVAGGRFIAESYWGS